MVKNDLVVVQDNSDEDPSRRIVGGQQLVETFPVDFARDFEDI
jgi:hypothetical protein